MLCRMLLRRDSPLYRSLLVGIFFSVTRRAKGRDMPRKLTSKQLQLTRQGYNCGWPAVSLAKKLINVRAVSGTPFHLPLSLGRLAREGWKTARGHVTTQDMFSPTSSSFGQATFALVA